LQRVRGVSESVRRRFRADVSAPDLLIAAVKNNRFPKIVNIDKSGANNAGIKDYNRKHGTRS